MLVLQQQLAVDGLACGLILGHFSPHPCLCTSDKVGRGSGQPLILAPGAQATIMEDRHSSLCVRSHLSPSSWWHWTSLVPLGQCPWMHLHSSWLWGPRVLSTRGMPTISSPGLTSPLRAGCGHLLDGFSPGFVTVSLAVARSDRAALQRALRPAGSATIQRMECGAQEAAGGVGHSMPGRDQKPTPAGPARRPRGSPVVRGVHQPALITKANNRHSGPQVCPADRTYGQSFLTWTPGDRGRGCWASHSQPHLRPQVEPEQTFTMCPGNLCPIPSSVPWLLVPFGRAGPRHPKGLCA